MENVSTAHTEQEGDFFQEMDALITAIVHEAGKMRALFQQAKLQSSGNEKILLETQFSAHEVAAHAHKIGEQAMDLRLKLEKQ